MLGISWTQAGDARGGYRQLAQAAPRAVRRTPSLLTHRDVLCLLALTVLVSTACLVNVAVGWRASESLHLFLVQMTCCVLVCPTLALAVRLPPSGFFGGHPVPWARLLSRCVYAVMAAEAVVVCWFYL
jgi:hypothetical protein